MERNWLSLPRADKIARLYGTKHASLREVGKALQSKVQTPVIVLYLLQGILTVQRSEISTKALDDFVEYLEKDTSTTAKAAEEAEERFILALLAISGNSWFLEKPVQPGKTACG